MDKKEVITLKDILKRKDFFEKRKNETKELYIKSLDANIVISKPTKELCIDVLDMEDTSEGDRYFIYEIIKEPNLHDTELHKEFNVKNPLDIIDKIFDPGEISGIAKEGLKFAGYTDGVMAVEDIKN